MYLAVDIGATKTLIALFSAHGRVLRRIKFLTNPDSRLFLSELLANLSDFTSRPILSVVVAVPGVVHKNCSVSPPNLPWIDFDIKSPLQSLFTCPIFVLNDANLATLYESAPYRGLSLYLTFSTGIGAGLALNGSVTPASSRLEPGHHLYSWDSGEKEWEDLASASALRRLFGSDVVKLRDSSSLDTVAYRLSLGLTDLIRKHSPSTVIIGGPVGLIFPRLAPYLADYLHSSLKTKRLPRLVPASRPLESVIYGCYLYARYHR